MKNISKMFSIFFLTVFLNIPAVFAAEFKASGEVVSADPLYGRITIKHGAIKDFAADGQYEYVVSSKGLLNDLARRDLIDFTIKEEKGDAEIIAITKTGVAPEEDTRLPLGKAVQGALETTAEVAKTVSSPIAPAHEVVSAATDATTNTTGAVLEEATPEVKTKF